MIGQKITINGVEWEEISAEDYYQIEKDYMFIKTYGEVKFYKKVEQQVFPKVFEGQTFNFNVYEDGTVSLENEYSKFLRNKDCEALKQALAFRDNLLSKELI
jgi:hypothetical protein